MAYHTIKSISSRGFMAFTRRMLRNHTPPQGCLCLSEVLRTAPGLQWAADLLSLSILATEKHALGEISNDGVNALLDEGGLTLGGARATLDQVHEPAARALQGVVILLLGHPASYGLGLRSIKSPSYSWTRQGGRPRGRRSAETMSRTKAEATVVRFSKGG